MPLILTFIALAVVGQAANLAISIAVENNVSAAASVPVFFALLLATFWVAWRLALWLIERPAHAVEHRHPPRHQAHA
jgi:uncharacterized protein (DUF2062 family)